VSSNIPFQAALLAHPKFATGDFNTGFIAEHYGKGFAAEDVPHNDPHFLVALSAFVRRKSRARTSGMSGQLAGYNVNVGQDYAVVVLDKAGKHQYKRVHIDEVQGGDRFDNWAATVKVDGSTYEIASDSRLNDIVIEGTVNGKTFAAQVERGTAKNPLALRVQHNGTQIECLVMSPRMADLHQLMPHKAPPDMSRYVLSPMPGLLVDVAVTVGQKVQAGERVAVIEAMKMENVLFAAADGVVGKVLAAKGESLSVDQAIIEFA
jgi:propionyl-CoA carboxylase alpha chain